MNLMLIILEQLVREKRITEQLKTGIYRACLLCLEDTVVSRDDFDEYAGVEAAKALEDAMTPRGAPSGWGKH